MAAIGEAKSQQSGQDEGKDTRVEDLLKMTSEHKSKQSETLERIEQMEE
jgi:hypothetical protein